MSGIVDASFVELARCHFPPRLQELILGISRSLAQGEPIGCEITELRSLLAELPPKCVHFAARDLQHISGFWLQGRRDRKALIAMVERHADLAWLLMFDGDGHVREASLSALASPPQSAFECAAIAYRMNDWVPQVRQAARAYASQHIPHTAPNVIAAAAEFLLTRLASAQRWDAEVRLILEDRLFAPAVLETITTKIVTATTGRTSGLLRQMLRRPEIDAALPDIASHAKLPRVRGIAAEVLVSGRFRWTEGTKRLWIDKSMGQYRTVAALEERRVGQPPDSAEIGLRLATDKSPLVRRGVAFALSEIWRTGGAVHDEAARLLAADRYPSVRFFAEFYLQRRKGAGIALTSASATAVA